MKARGTHKLTSSLKARKDLQAVNITNTELNGKETKKGIQVSNTKF